MSEGAEGAEGGSGRSDASLLMLTNVCSKWDRVDGVVCALFALMRGQAKCPCLPINCTPQGLAPQT